MELGVELAISEDRLSFTFFRQAISHLNDWCGVLALAFSISITGLISSAQERVADDSLISSMIADDLYFDQDRQFYNATGNVQIFFDGLELRAPSVAYDVVSNRVVVDGPLMLIDEAGQQTIYGDFADMSADLRDGVITSARQLIDQNMQIASDQLVRRDGRYTEVEYVRASACEVCSENATPLWELS
jgi:LPS-assembly protein